jgi:hypothetical protein
MVEKGQPQILLGLKPSAKNNCTNSRKWFFSFTLKIPVEKKSL